MREATPSDMPDILVMMDKFHKSSNLPYGLDFSACSDIMGQMMKHGFVARSDYGFICGVIVGSPLNPSWKIAKEFLWWSEDKNGMKLLNMFREWAKKMRADEVQLSCPPEASRVRCVYSRFGVESEAVYSEVLTCV